MTQIARFEWTETHDYTAYVEVPDDFDLDSFDTATALAEINTDIHYTGCSDRTVVDFGIVPRVAVPPNEEVEEIDWASHDER